MAAGVEVDGLPLWRGQGSALQWMLDLDRFESLLRPSTSVVAVNFPNNPTGFVPDRATWQALNDRCHERGIRVISDEVYRGIEVDPARTLPAAVEINPSAVTISVLSKAYGLPGLRIGWVASRDRGAVSRLERAKHYTSICNAAPSEFLGALALRHGPTLLQTNRALVRANDRIAAEVLGRYPDLFDYGSPDGGCVCFPRYMGGDGVSEFCRTAVEDAGILLLPSTVYRSGLASVPNDRFRIGIGRRSVPDALAALESHLQRR